MAGSPQDRSSRWARIDELFRTVIEAAPEDRLRIAEEGASGDRELLDGVLRLLDASERSDGLLEGSGALLADLSAEALGEPGEEEDDGLIGEILDVYRLVRVVGRGGSGTVYLAERVDGLFDQRVAVKILRRGLDTDDILARFRAEQRILASLDHPNIARLLHGGATPDGRPYFVMEYIQGRKLTDYCDERRLDLEGRVRLIVSVIRAVQHAHRGLVVHRDLKPSNILVTEDGTPKLLDFGIAKLVARGDSDEETPRTRTGFRLLTPDYASPEQLRGEAVTTETDVYQLGVLLYRLSTGRLPFGRGSTDRRLRQTPGSEPMRPSVSVLHHPESAPAGCARRRLPRALRGDLDTIILKALRDDPERRYGGAAQLADDLERYLAGRPIAARPDNVGYRLAKLVRRRPGSVAAGVAMVLIACAYVVTLLMHADRLAVERDRAQAETAKAEQVSQFLVDLYDVANPQRGGRGDTVSVRTLLDRGVHRIHTEFVDRPALRGRMLSELGDIYARLGNYGEAELRLREALEAQREVYGPSSPHLIHVTDRLAFTLVRMGYLGEAEVLHRHSLDTALEQHGEVHTTTSTALNNLGLVQAARGRLREAEAAYRRALAIRDRLGLDPDPVVLDNLATVLQSSGAHEEALALHREAIRRHRALNSRPNQSLAIALNGYASTLHRSGDFAAAEATHREALAMRRDVLPPGHPDIASSLARLGLLMIETGRAAEAEPLVAEAYDMLVDRIPDAWETVAVRSILGFSRAAQGRLEEGTAPMIEAYEYFLGEFGPDDWRTRDTAGALAGLYSAAGRPEMAERFRHALLTAH